MITNTNNELIESVKPFLNSSLDLSVDKFQTDRTAIFNFMKQKNVAFYIKAAYTDAKIYIDVDLVLSKWNRFNDNLNLRVGDFVKFNHTYHRFSHDHGNVVQTTEKGTFFLQDSSLVFPADLIRRLTKANLNY